MPSDYKKSKDALKNSIVNIPVTVQYLVIEGRRLGKPRIEEYPAQIIKLLETTIEKVRKTR